MEQLTAYKTALPSSVEEVADFVVLNEEKLNAVKAAIRAARKAGAINLEELERQQRELEVATVLAQCKLGELTREIETARGGDRRSMEFQTSKPRTFETKETALANIGLTKQRASEYELMSEHPEIVDKAIDSGEHVTKAAILKEIKAARKKERKEAKQEAKKFSVPKELPDTCELFVADVESGIERVPKNSVDFIITDPPYPKEYIRLYECLSDLAADVLKDGGSLLVMCGQSYLPEVIERLCTSMTYHWTLCYLTPGGQSPSLWQKNTNTFWKPIIWMTKGKYGGDYIGDVIKTDVNSNDKRFHEWGQSENGMASIIEKFTYPGDVIMDPFLGGGTTGVCAVSMGRRFIGCDISEECVNKSRERIINSLNGSQE